MRLKSPVCVVVIGLCGGACTPEPTSTREALPFAAAGPDDSDTDAPDPSIEGPYPVGVTTITLVDDLRPEENGPRTFPIEVWYPAKEGARDEDKESIQLFNALPVDLQEGLRPEDLGVLPTIAVRDAAARADDDDVYPLVIFSHGKGGLRLQSTYYTTFLASHGYVVAAPDHSGDTIVELLREVKEEGAIQADSTVEAIVDRPKDVIAMLDLLEDLLPADVAAVTDLSRVGVTGHSFGALTSFLVATMDSRVDVVVGQTPTSQDVIALQQQTPLEEVSIPMVIQSATLDETLPEDTNARPLYETLTSSKAWLSLTRGGHFTYSDLCVLDVEAISVAVDLDVSNVLEDGCGPDALPAALAQPAIRSSAIGTFNVHLRGSDGSKSFLTQAALDVIAPGEGVFVSEPPAP
ncbi:MAG: dienelactone hydrolase family protein [Deltaproteobacteria bacterium]|nr:dienelactone hydrolase family protein [Deltaproteobacteria bacterium]